MTTTTRTYLAIAAGEMWSVGVSTGGSVRRMQEVRLFASYEEADDCAKQIAAGKFDRWNAGNYVSNR